MKTLNTNEINQISGNLLIKNTIGNDR